jgi:hypothetical protein
VEINAIGTSRAIFKNLNRDRCMFSSTLGRAMGWRPSFGSSGKFVTSLGHPGFLFGRNLTYGLHSAQQHIKESSMLRITCAATLSFALLRSVLADAPATPVTPVPDAPRFERQVLDSKVAIGYGVAIGDVDGDGKRDVLLADKKQFAWYRNGDWKRFVMAENLTSQDNVCIAARDIDGDGKVEVAVGAGWNPADTVNSGSVHYLIRPADPTQKWEVVDLHHEPTVHRMGWVRTADKTFQLVVVPLHGRGNKAGQGEGVKVLAYDVPKNPKDSWTTHELDGSMHMTHNFTILLPDPSKPEEVLLGGREGAKHLLVRENPALDLPGCRGVGEIRYSATGSFLATIEPMHGNQVVVYRHGAAPLKWTRQVLDEDLHEGHALACADFLGLGRDQIVAGWRLPNSQKKVGIKLYVPLDKSYERWQSFAIDEQMACEDLKVADLDGDGRADIIASGRASHDLVILWNRNGAAR